LCVSGRKYDAITLSGISILKRYDIPGVLPHLLLKQAFRSPALLMHCARLEHLIPMDSRVEIDAKIAAGYFTSGKSITHDDLVKTVGRTWEETEH
jgi:hypothetical protein